MTFNLDRFREFCADDRATMVARACRDESRLQVFACSHELGCQPLGEDELVLRRLDPATRDALGVFYADHTSAALFIVEHEPGLVLAPPSEWESLYAEVEEWWRNAVDELEDDERLTLESALVFGLVPQAATYFLLPRAGERQGKVVMFCHDGLELIAVGDSFSAFVAAIPDRAVSWFAGDIRYAPVEPGGQFYPVAYRPRGIERPTQKVVRIWLESENHADPENLTFRETTPSGVTVRSPAGHDYDLVVELYPNDEASVSILSDEAHHLYVRGHGAMRALGTLLAGDVANVEVENEVG